MSSVYLIHFDPPYRHFQHYVGATNKHPLERLREHSLGQGARLTKQAVAAGSVPVRRPGDRRRVAVLHLSQKGEAMITVFAVYLIALVLIIAFIRGCDFT